MINTKHMLKQNTCLTQNRTPIKTKNMLDTKRNTWFQYREKLQLASRWGRRYGKLVKPVICMCFTYSELHNSINFTTRYSTYVLSTLHYDKCLTNDLTQIHYSITTMEYKKKEIQPFRKH